MNLCDGDCGAGRKIQELQQLVAGMEGMEGVIEMADLNPHWTDKYVADWHRVLELLDIPTF